jgi:hypothetical protein
MYNLISKSGIYVRVQSGYLFIAQHITIVKVNAQHKKIKVQ